jgi:1,4-dihydroxy-2-naphthoate octaprenyltransferase
LKTIIDYFLFTSLFIAVCAISMIFQTYFLFSVPVSYPFVWFIFFGSLSSYNFHWYLTPAIYGGSYKTQWSTKRKNLHLVLFIIGIIGSAYFGVQLLYGWPWLLVSAFITFLYSAPKIPFQPFLLLRRIAVGKTIFLSLVWTHCTVILPLVLQHTRWDASHFLFAINRFFLIYPICILFDYRDRESDRKEGIKSLITYLPDKGVHRLFWYSLVIHFISAIALWLTRFYWADSIVLTVPAILVSLLYRYAKETPSDYLYYFVLDGLMMFSALLLFIIHF